MARQWHAMAFFCEEFHFNALDTRNRWHLRSLFFIIWDLYLRFKIQTTNSHDHFITNAVHFITNAFVHWKIPCYDHFITKNLVTQRDRSLAQENFSIKSEAKQCESNEMEKILQQKREICQSCQCSERHVANVRAKGHFSDSRTLFQYWKARSLDEMIHFTSNPWKLWLN